MAKRMSLVLLVLAVAAGTALAKDILVVAGSGPARLAALAEHGVRAYGWTDDFILAEDRPGNDGRLVAAGLSATRLRVPDRTPLYLAEVRQALPGRVTPLLASGRTVLLALDRSAADAVAAAGAELMLLPDEPRPVNLPGEISLPRVALADTFVQRLLEKVSPDSIYRQIRRLEDFRTRFSYAESCRKAEDYICQYFQAQGVDSVELFAYEHQGNTWRNPIGTIRGRANPDKVVIVCGHMDATSQDPNNLAPGAEDNASGTAMAMEACRVFAGERPDMTLKFIGFSGEEQGLIGSLRYAEAMRGQGADIVGVLNFDMIAYEGGRFGVSLFCDSASLTLAEFEGLMADIYTTLDHDVNVARYGSDQLSFHYYGYHATAGGEFGNGYPWYHTTADTIGNLSMPLAAEVAKLAIAGAATIAFAPAPPDGFVLADAGTGGALYAAWQPNAEPDLAAYKLLWGTQSRNYTDSVVLGRATSHRIDGLVNGTRYYGTVTALDSAGHEGGPAPERSAVPGLVPLAPQGFAALPFPWGVGLAWRANEEYDLAGYNLYRSTVSGSGYERLNTALLTDTTYRDSALLSDTMYYYVVTAVDTSANESRYSAEVRGKPVTLDHGILLVDETRDGSGQPGSPTDPQQDDFYHGLLRGFQYTDWDAAEKGVPGAADLGPYSTIVWHADDNQQQLVYDALPGLANHLGHGGRLWLCGWKPVYGLANRLGSYPYNFSPGQFSYDCFHLRRAEQSLQVDFTGAQGVSGYPSVTVDSAKLLPAMHGRLIYVDAVLPRDADTILTFNSFSGDTFAGKPVGVRWLGGPYRTVLFGFPLYFMKDAEARQLALKVLSDLGEPYGIAEGPTPYALRHALDATPNPARNVLRISCSLPASSWARLSLFDASGRIVLDRSLPCSLHSTPYSLDVRSLSAGIYFLRLDSDSGPLTRQVVVLR